MGSGSVLDLELTQVDSLPTTDTYARRNVHRLASIRPMSMSGETCGVLSQIVPVFILALVVEWRGNVATLPSDQARVAGWLLAVNIALYGGLEMLMVVGLQAKGLTGFWGVVGWLGSATLLWYTLAHIIFGILRSTGQGTDLFK
jgi:fucose 4-O-acetylase-like acetyltransferase